MRISAQLISNQLDFGVFGVHDEILDCHSFDDENLDVRPRRQVVDIVNQIIVFLNGQQRRESGDVRGYDDESRQNPNCENDA